MTDRASFSKAASNIFDSVDTDRNGYLDKQEVDRAATSRNDFNPTESAALATMKLHHDVFSRASNDEWGRETTGITKEDINKAYQDKSILPDLQIVNDYAIQYYSQENRLFAGAKPSDKIAADAIQQGQAGDCWFLAAVAGFADTPRGKEAIEKMITPIDGGKQYTVKFPADDTGVRVNAPTSFELMQYTKNTNGDSGTWAPVLEKAMGQTLRRTAAEKSFVPADQIGGNSLQLGIETLTGNKAEGRWMKDLKEQEISNLMSNAFAEKHIFTACIEGNHSNPYNLPTGHAYTVLGFDAKTGMVKLRNPWGPIPGSEPDALNADKKLNGTFEMKLDEFQKTFDYVAYETQQPLRKS